MKHLFYYLALTGLLAGQTASANTADAHQKIQQTLSHYIEGTRYNDQKQLEQAFHPAADLFLASKEKPIWKVSQSEYLAWFKSPKQRQHNNRIGEILNIQVAGNIATAKAEIIIPSKATRYIDLFLLKKLDEQWQIISKTADSIASNQHGERILFILSSAFYHGNSDLRAGVSFSEIVNAYDEFKNAGYTIDFVSPAGGSLPLSYINTSQQSHRQYLYDADFMYAIGNTKTPSEINPESYVAVHYVGGSNAMYGVAENTELQAISMHVYQRNKGLVSSVCHGTAGIVNLKLDNGEYLVKGKRISGYPDQFEAQDRAYFKQFPFLIQQTIEQRGGKFLHSQRGTPHVEVDGRIITGQNYQSSRAVAKSHDRATCITQSRLLVPVTK